MEFMHLRIPPPTVRMSTSSWQKVTYQFTLQWLVLIKHVRKNAAQGPDKPNSDERDWKQIILYWLFK